jgi:hypothetical protein
MEILGTIWIRVGEICSTGCLCTIIVFIEEQFWLRKVLGLIEILSILSFKIGQIKRTLEICKLNVELLYRDSMCSCCLLSGGVFLKRLDLTEQMIFYSDTTISPKRTKRPRAPPGYFYLGSSEWETRSRSDNKKGPDIRLSDPLYMQS